MTIAPHTADSNSLELFEIHQQKRRIEFKINKGRFLLKTIKTAEELKAAYELRYQVFQVEMVGLSENSSGLDSMIHPEVDPRIDKDEFDQFADHLAILDQNTNQMIATCRLISSDFSNHFYSEQEFNCKAILSRLEKKLEIGRVCVHKDFRRSVILMLLWRGIAEFMVQSKSEILFGCGSVQTLDPHESINLYLYLQEKGKLKSGDPMIPTEKYRSVEFDEILSKKPARLSSEDSERAKELIPPLCRSYFDIGCYIGGPPAFDRNFKCIDFFIILEVSQLGSRIKNKMFGSDGA